MYRGRLPSTLRDLYSGDFHQTAWKGVSSALLYPIRDVSHKEVLLCCLLSCMLELDTISYTLKEYIVLSCLTVAAIGSTAFWRKAVLPNKTFYVDHPIVACNEFGDNCLAISGGGGGLAYGIEDTLRILEIRNSKLRHISGIPINLFCQANVEDYPILGDELNATEVLIGEQVPMVTLWGMSTCPKRRLLAGGFKSRVHVYQQEGEKFEARIRLVLDDEVMPDQSRLKRAAIVNRTCFSRSGLLVAATSERRDVFLYLITPVQDLAARSDTEGMANDYTSVSEFGDTSWLESIDPQRIGVIELGRSALSEDKGEPTDIAISNDEKFVMVSTSSGHLCWLRIPTPRRWYDTRSTGSVKGGPSVILYSPAPLEVVAESRVALNEAFYIKRMKLRPSDAKSKAELYFSGSQRQNFRAKTHERGVQGIMRCTYEIDANGPNLVSPPPALHLIDTPGINALAFNCKGDNLAVVSNETFWIINPDTMRVKHLAARFQQGREVDTLPTTSVAFIRSRGEDAYLVVGSGDYSITVVPLRPLIPSHKSIFSCLWVTLQMPYKMLTSLYSICRRVVQYSLIIVGWSLLVFLSLQVITIVGHETGLGKASEL
eukprot:Blabericola_migrator_1__12386@NODE_778_length_6562_cov_75_694072_g553_i0_p2_GENE_NODE_778_length_6562_cov_75_694072_g553_i0NODE_778_length_6562_cov_75_694072_g553_i0_p2_ORF_typecomplete_len601_score72_80ANAPC4_WD40/PF12894_7/4_1e03ANAPC4_WD40/PF12894_7/1_3ANAPC4_WD40/PF12894_7/1_7e02ANAPC4_WD40/PF12894_7/1_7e02SGL/PF08450_12/1_8e02SGL/PF08450_12/0_11_NODE_778_length_6562_cov_75_694072_g553_i047216523